MCSLVTSQNDPDCSILQSIQWCKIHWECIPPYFNAVIQIWIEKRIILYKVFRVAV